MHRKHSTCCGQIQPAITQKVECSCWGGPPALQACYRGLAVLPELLLQQANIAGGQVRGQRHAEHAALLSGQALVRGVAVGGAWQRPCGKAHPASKVWLAGSGLSREAVWQCWMMRATDPAKRSRHCNMHAGCLPALLAVCALLTGCCSSQAAGQGPLPSHSLGPERSHVLLYC